MFQSDNTGIKVHAIVPKDILGSCNFYSIKESFTRATSLDLLKKKYTFATTNNGLKNNFTYPLHVLLFLISSFSCQYFHQYPNLILQLLQLNAFIISNDLTVKFRQIFIFL